MSFINSINDWVYSHWLLLLIILILGAAFYVFGPFPPIGGGSPSSPHPPDNGPHPSPDDPHPPSGPGPTLGSFYQSQGDSGKTITSFLIGIAASILLTLIIWSATTIFMGSYFDIPDFPWFAWSLRNAVGLLLGILAGFFFFETGRFNIEPSHQAYATFLGYPFTMFGVGDGWVIPGLMEVHSESTAAHQDVGEGPSKYPTKNGVPITLDSESTYVVENVLRATRMPVDQRPQFVAATRAAAVRKYIGTKEFRVSELNPGITEENTPLSQRTKILEFINGLKGEISNQGPEWVLKEMNYTLREFGLRAKQVQLENVSFDPTMEKKAERIYDEMLEGAGLGLNSVNQSNVADSIMDRTLARAGLKKEDLTPDQRLRLATLAHNQAMSAEGQASVIHVESSTPITPNVNVGGQPQNTQPPSPK